MHGEPADLTPAHEVIPTCRALPCRPCDGASVAAARRRSASCHPVELVAQRPSILRQNEFVAHVRSRPAEPKDADESPPLLACRRSFGRSGEGVAHHLRVGPELDCAERARQVERWKQVRDTIAVCRASARGRAKQPQTLIFWLHAFSIQTRQLCGFPHMCRVWSCGL